MFSAKISFLIQLAFLLIFTGCNQLIKPLKKEEL